MADPIRPTRQWPGPPVRGSAPPPAPPAPPVGDPPPSEETPVDTASDADHDVEAAEEQVDADLGEFAAVVAERDDYLDRLRRLQADFENYKKRVAKQQLEHQERAAGDLLTQLLPVLDTFDLAVAHGSEGVAPVHRSMLDVLAGNGLERLDPMGQPFDPNEHDAVVHEAAADGGEPEVTEVLRAGYRWKGRVLRPAMVKVKG